MFTSIDLENATVPEMKAIMKADIETRYAKQSNVLNMSTALDPMFKNLPYLSDEERHEVYSTIVTESAKFAQIKMPKIKVELGSESEPKPPVFLSLPALPSLPSAQSIEEPIGSSLSNVKPLSHASHESMPSPASLES